MPYTKQTWTNGDMLTAAKLNHMEDGIANAGGGGGFFVTCMVDVVDSEVTMTLDCSWNELYEAFQNGLVFTVIDETVLMPGPDVSLVLFYAVHIDAVSTPELHYGINFINGGGTDLDFECQDPEDCPVYSFSMNG